MACPDPAGLPTVKRSLFILLPLLLIGALVLFGNRMVAGALDAQLAPLLTRTLGLPVYIAPTDVGLLQLHARSAELVLGEPSDPAVTARGVEVRLSLSALLDRQIRFVFVGADELTVNPARWPPGEGTPPTDYRFLEPWLPQQLDIASGSYVGDGYRHPVRDLHWQRLDDGSATLDWAEARGDSTLRVRGGLAALDDLLHLRSVELNVELSMDNAPESSVRLQAHIQPGPDRAYELGATVRTAGMTARVNAGHAQAWQPPDTSDIAINILYTDRLAALIDVYSAAEDAAPRDMLDTPLPRLSLPLHAGSVSIAEIRLGDELGLDTTFDFATSETGFGITDLRSVGPEGRIRADFDIASSDAGWSIGADATISARDDGESNAARFLDSHWYWRTGHARLTGTGATWGELLYSLSGDTSLKGYHRGQNNTPVSIEARLDNRPGQFALENLSVEAGEGSISGSASLGGSEPRSLSLKLSSTGLNLDFLFATGEDAETPVGVALPDYLRLFPGVEIDIEMDVENLVLPGVNIADASATLQRHALGGTLALTGTGPNRGGLNLTLDVSVQENAPDQVDFIASLERVDLPAIFRQQGPFKSRSSGRLELRSSGEGTREIFQRMRGHAEVTVELRADNDWSRPTGERERVDFSGDATLVLDGERIVGVEVADIDIESLEQDLTGTVSVIGGREPWLVADLESKALNISRLLEQFPTSTEEADQRDILQTLRGLVSQRINLTAQTLVIADTPLSSLRLEVESAEDLLAVRRLDFGADGSAVNGQGRITWEGERATLESAAQLERVDLDQFLIHDPGREHVPVSGSVQLNSDGETLAELLTNLQGYVELSAADGEKAGTPQRRRQLAMQAERRTDGMAAVVRSLQWGANELAGRVRYYDRERPLWDIDIDRGVLDLSAWEEASVRAQETAEEESVGGTLGNAARTSANFVGDFLLTPVRLLAGDDEKETGGDKLFSADPLPLASLQDFDLDVSGRIDSVSSSVLNVDDLEVKALLTAGELDLELRTAHMNGGRGDLQLVMQTAGTPATLSGTTTFHDVKGLAGGDTYPRSGFLSAETRGDSPAEFAANLSGLLYLELGKGPFDYGSTSLLTEDLANSIMRTLIPGIDRQQPSLRCGTAVFLAKDGMVGTPFGYALQTNTANILGRMEMDLRKEQLQLNFDSRSREGVGISVGNVFSNTIRVGGSLSDPRIVPNTTGILWRGWAAFMTAGLSIVGESVLKRALASSDPCASIRTLVQRDLCPNNDLAAASDMVCPDGG